jgi:hypothetical protein
LNGEGPLAEERKAFWQRIGIMPTAHEIADLEALHDWLITVRNETERRALLAWARSKVGGKSFRRWCFQVEGNPSRNRPAPKRSGVGADGCHSCGRTVQNSENREIRVLPQAPEISDVSDTVEEDAAAGMA